MRKEAQAEPGEDMHPTTIDDAVDLLDNTVKARDRFATERVAPGRASSCLPARGFCNEDYGESTVGRFMEPAAAVFSPEQTIAGAIDEVRELAKSSFVTYGFIADTNGKLLGVVAMRDLLLSARGSHLCDVMLRDPFFLVATVPLTVAMNQVLRMHFPVYPVCDSDGILLGQVRGHTLFQNQAYQISAQPGRMVGVNKEEHLSTSWKRSIQLRQPWLQLNLLTAFVAAGVVGLFQGTIERVVLLAAFLPVLAGQSGNTGMQALAVTLRGMTLGMLPAGKGKNHVFKEGLLGLINGTLAGLTAGLGMFLAASAQSHPAAATLAASVFCAMVGSCFVSGLSGALIPITLRRLGADPATASSIFLTTATDVVSMGLLLSLVTVLLR